MIGREVGPYWVLEPVSRGPAGTAFKGVHKTREEEVVIREVAPGSFTDAAERERFLRAANFLRRAAPRRIARIHLCQTDGESVLLVTENVPLTLEEQLAKDGPLSEETAVRIAITLLEALQYLHRYQIVHGHVSPSTVLVGPGGLVKLGFFAPAAPLHEGGETAATLETDIFALGALLARMLGSDDSPSAVAQDASATPVSPISPISPISPALREAVAKALAAEPTKRYASAAEFADALRRVAAGTDPKTPAALPTLDFPREAAALALLGLLIFCLIFALTRQVPNALRGERTRIPPPPRVGTEIPPATGPAASPQPPPPVTVQAAVEHPEQARSDRPHSTKKKHHLHKKNKGVRHHRETVSIPVPAAISKPDEADTWSIRK